MSVLRGLWGFIRGMAGYDDNLIALFIAGIVVLSITIPLLMGVGQNEYEVRAEIVGIERRLDERQASVNEEYIIVFTQDSEQYRHYIDSYKLTPEMDVGDTFMYEFTLWFGTDLDDKFEVIGEEND